MTQCITTKEAAEQLQVHARTIRKWIEVFEEFICPDLNEKGHYILSPESFQRLKEIKQRLSEPNKTMKQVREELIIEEKIPSESESSYIKDETIYDMMRSIQHVGELMEELYDRMERMEEHVCGLYDSLEEMEQKLVTISYDRISANEVQQMFDEIRKKQDQLKMELRHVHFTQRIAAATGDGNFVPRRQRKSRFLFFF